MTALGGFHHVGVLTTDLDRLLAFYRTVFDAEPVVDRIDGGVRSALIDVGGGGFLHAFEVPEGQMPLAGQPKYQRGRLDHLALAAPIRPLLLSRGGETKVLLGQSAGEVIHEAAMALRFGATTDDFIDLIHVYPTMAEALKLVAISFTKDVNRLSCCVS